MIDPLRASSTVMLQVAATIESMVSRNDYRASSKSMTAPCGSMSQGTTVVSVEMRATKSRLRSIRLRRVTDSGGHD